MATLTMSRPERNPPASVPAEPTPLPAPPRRDDGAATGSGWQAILPALGSVGALVFILNDPKPITIVAGGLFMVAAMAGSVGMVIVNHRSRFRQRDRGRSRYLDRLDVLSCEAAENAAAERRELEWRHPSPSELLGIACSSRLWERQRGDPDYLSVRLGVTTRPPAAPLERWSSDDPMVELDPVLVRAADDVIRRHRMVPDLPHVLDLAASPEIVLAGDPARARELARAIVTAIAVAHAPGDVSLVVVTSTVALSDWSWARWLPHAAPGAVDEATRAVPLVTSDVQRIAELSIEMAERGAPGAPPPAGHLVVVDDGGVLDPFLDGSAIHGYRSALTMIRCGSFGGGSGWSGARAVTLDVSAGGTATTDDDGTLLTVDRLDVATADAVARATTGIRLVGGAGPERQVGGNPLASVMSVADLLAPDVPDQLDVIDRWRRRSLGRRLQVQLGVAEDGDIMTLDLNEAALDGMGPHGLLVGATGSGKSELLRTLVIGLALDHSPEDVSFVLVDFKGGAAFAGLQGLPHVAGLITNLVDDQALVDRMHDALKGELRRRQELLRAAGQLGSRKDYLEARQNRPELPALPSLLVVIDEFAELLEAKPDFIDLFGAIGRLGRSLGIHLLFSSQRLEEGRLRGLESHLSYRIALRTFSGSDSRAVIGTDDAFTLPSTPGVGILKVDTRVYKRFRCALASSAWEPRAVPTEESASASSPGVSPGVTAFGADPVAAHARPEKVEGVAAEPVRQTGRSRSLLDVLVERVVIRRVEPARAVWLPPLPPVLTMDVLVSPMEHPERGLQSTRQPLGTLRFPFGLADLPDEQRKEVAVFDGAHAGGNLLIVGAPQTGKTMMLRSLIAGAALTHTAEEVQFYVLDLGGGGLDTVALLPHVGAVAGRHEPERVSRIVHQMEQVLERRGRLFAGKGIDGLAAFRALRQRGDLPEETHGDVFLVIDNWAVFRAEFEELSDRLGELATRSASFGLHFVVTANRSMDLRYNLKDLFGNRLELRLTDTTDSEVDRQAAAALPKIPGRCLRPDSRQVQVALPRIDSRLDLTTLTEGAADLVEAVRSAWRGREAPAVQLLPAEIGIGEIGAGFADDGSFVIGLDEASLGPVGLPLMGGESHALIFGDTGMGKTNALRVLADSIMAVCSPEQARFLVVDPRRTLLGAIPQSHLATYCPSPASAEEALGRLATTLAGREPPADLSIEQVQNRSWWSGPEIYVLIDDYELWSSTRQNPLLSLAEWLPHAADLGLHVVLARRMGGAGRSLYDPLVQQIRELCDQGLLLSGDPSEGPLLGNIKPDRLPVGRALLLRRRRTPSIVQTALAVSV